jgi:hypothetical protein
VQIFAIEENINVGKNEFLKGLTGVRTVINVTELDIPAILGERCLDATVLVVIGVDVGVGCTGVALNEKEKLLEQHVGVLTTSWSSLAAFENCWAGRPIAAAAVAAAGLLSAGGGGSDSGGRRFAMHVVASC